MSTESTSTYRIDPLRGADNYAVWKVKMTDILTDLSLIDYISATAPTLASDQSKTTTIQNWTTKDRKALSTIRLRVADGPLVYIASAKTSKDAWETLKTNV